VCAIVCTQEDNALSKEDLEKKIDTISKVGVTVRTR
jgi:hypothetical protein